MNHSELGLPPIVVWQKATELDIPTRYLNAGLDQICRKSAERSITGGRVNLFNLSWTSPALPDLAGRLATHPEKDKVVVLYDETDLSHVYVVDPDDATRLVRADPVDPRYQNGLTLAEHKAASAALKAAGKDAQNTKLLNEARKKMWDEFDVKTARARKQFARMRNEKVAEKLRQSTGATEGGQLSNPQSGEMRETDFALPRLESTSSQQGTELDLWDESSEIYQSL